MPDLNGQGLLPYYQALNNISSLTPGTWNINTEKRHSFVVFGDFNAVHDGKISPEQPDTKNEYITKFSDLELTLENTKVVTHQDGTEQIELKLPSKILTLLFDQSGSMSWNDNEGLRHTISRRLVERTHATYPGDVRYNVVKFGGMPVDVTLFAVLQTEDFNTDDTIQSASARFFEDEENNFAGIRILRKVGSYPTHPLDGEILQDGFFSKTIDLNLTEGTKYYYRIYTYDKYYHFSEGVGISGTPQERIVPRGVARVSSNILTGTGISRDNYTIGLWHFGEGIDATLYDFSNYKNHLTIPNDSIWLNPQDIPLGRSGIRFNGVGTVAATSNDSSSLTLSNNMTIMGLIYPYDLSQSCAIVSRRNALQTDYALYITGNGRLTFTADGVLSVSTAGIVLTENEWNYVAVVINGTNIDFYVNDILVDSQVFTLGAHANVTDMVFRLGSYLGGLATVPFFGRMTEFSVHATNRSSAYVSKAGTIPIPDVNLNEVITTTNTNQDNGDRLFIAQYDVPADRNFDEVLIIRNDNNVPSWEEDGILMGTMSVTGGRYTFTDIDDFVSDRTYYYRLVTRNSLGNYSYQSDSPVINVKIPVFSNFSDIESLSSFLFPITNLTARAGDRKVYLRWNSPVIDNRVKSVQVYYSDAGYPVIGNMNEVSGELVFDGTVDKEQFVHRHIDNAKGAFYTVVVRDKYGRASEPVNISSVPISGTDESGIPLLEVDNIHWDIVDNETLSILWTVPIDFKSNLTGYLDQRVLIYAAVTDEFGAPISNITQVSMDLSATITRVSMVEDVFGTSTINSGDYSDSDFYKFGAVQESGGVVRGNISIVNNSAMLSLIEKAEFQIKVTSKIPDPANPSKYLFEFFSSPITISLINPYSVKTYNRDGRSVVRKCPKSLDNVGFAAELSQTDLGFENKSFDGSYVRASNPFVVRTLLSYKGESLKADAAVQISVWDATDGVCGGNFSPSRLQESESVVPLSNSITVQTELVEKLDENSNPTGETQEISYADIPLTIPRFPQGVIVYVQSSYLGYTKTQSMFLLMENILTLELTASAPIGDGINIAEQMANVWLKDPDNPNDDTKRTPVPDSTLIRWSLIRKQFGQNRPFYSTETIVGSISGGVKSYTQSGIARHIYFGPADNVVWNSVVNKDSGLISLIGERYEVRANVVYDGLSSGDQQLVEIYPLGKKNKFGDRFLMEFPEYKNILWADGEDYLRLIISRDGNNPSSFGRIGSCFCACSLIEGANLVSFDPGQIIHVSCSAELEIIWGDVRESIDPYTGEKELIFGKDAQISHTGSSLIEMKDADETFVFFRINKFFPTADPLCSEGSSGSNLLSLNDIKPKLNPCECLGIVDDKPLLRDQCQEYLVAGDTIILVDQKPVTLRGGGTVANGVPPTIVVPREPLNISVVDKRVNGIPSETFLIDGVTPNEIILEVTFAGLAVPDGTPITAQIASALEGGLPNISLVSVVIYTEKKIDAYIDPLNARSYAKVIVNPISPEYSVSEQIIFTTTYDRSKEVTRSKQVCVTISWEAGSDDMTEEAEQVIDIFDKRLYAYNIATNAWDDTLRSMNHARGHAVMESNEDTYRDHIMSLGPVAYYRLGEDVGSLVAEDEIGNNDGTYGTNQTLETDGLIYHSINKSVRFDGQAGANYGYVQIPASVDMEFTDKLSVFIRINAADQQFSTVVNKMDWNGAPGWISSFSMGKSPLGDLRMFVFLSGDGTFGGAAWKNYRTSMDVFDGNDHTVGFTWEGSVLPTGGTLRIYVDGVEDTAVTKVFDGVINNIWPAIGDDVFIATGIHTGIIGTNHFTGTIDEVAFFKQTLTPAQALLMHQKAITTGKLNVIGGIDKSTISQINESYDLTTNTWADVTIMPTARFGSVSVAIGNKIYVFGGLTADSTGTRLVVSNALEVYNIDTDDWTMLEPMPTIDDISINGTSYGVAFGSARYLHVGGEDRIYILAGVREVDEAGRVKYYNDRILYYLVNSDSWSVSDPFVGQDFELYKRISPIAFVENNNIIIQGGSILDGNDAQSQLVYLKDSMEYNPLTGLIRVNDSDYRNIPNPRSYAAYTSMGTDHYFLGGSNNVSQDLVVFEGLDTTADPWTLTTLTNVPQPITGSKTALATTISDPYALNPFIFCASGFQSGRDAGFLQIRTNIAPDRILLDGKQSAAIAVELIDREGKHPVSDVRLRVRGYIKFKDESIQQTTSQIESQTESAQRNISNATDDEMAIYPVIFSNNDIVTSDGMAVVTLLARSEDVLQAIETIKQRSQTTNVSGTTTSQILISAGEIREPYSILIKITIDDDFYYGQTVENLTSLMEQAETTSTEIIASATGEESSLCKEGPQIKGSLQWQGYSRGIDIGGLVSLQTIGEEFSNEKSATTFNLVPAAFGQLNSPIVGCYSDIEWIPSITSLLSGSDSTVGDTLKILKNLENEIPFGASTLFDSIITCSDILSPNSLNDRNKIIYIFTDNENNMSRYTLSEAIESVNAIDGDGKIPLVIGNFSVISPITLSAKANITDTDDLNKLVDMTMGQSITVLSSDFVNETVNIFIGQAVGSLGYGSAIITLDLGSICEINKLSAMFDLLTNTTGKWSVEVSNDKLTWTIVPDTYKANTEITYQSLNGRYVKFFVILITGFSASNEPVYELVPLPASPALVELKLNYNQSLTTYLYLNTNGSTAPVQQIVVGVDASNINTSDIEAGVASSDSHNWLDYQGPSQPHIDQNGKIFVPIRLSEDNELTEPLLRVDKYTYRTKFGRWEPTSLVEILDSNEEVVDISTYTTYPRDGLVIFNQRKTEDYKITIQNANSFRVGLKLVNRSTTTPLEVHGVGYMYNTNIFLNPPPENIAPEAKSVILLPSEPTPYSKIEATYEFTDINGDAEDIEDREIRWYINGVRISYLDDLLVWNDITNLEDPIYSHALSFKSTTMTVSQIVAQAQLKEESILKPGDSLYFTIRVSDGELKSDIAQSSTLTIGETPPQVESIVIKGLLNNTITDKLTAAHTAVAQFTLLSDSNTNNSIITWYVNGDEFKIGAFGIVENIDRIIPGEANALGDIALLMNNEIYVQIVPNTSGSSGTPVQSDTVVVQNAIPIVSNVTVAPANPKVGQNLVLSFMFADADSTYGQTTQSNLSTVRWYKSSKDTNYQFVEVASLANQSTVKSAETKRNDQWKSIVTPYDGLDLGTPITSNIVTIR